MQDDTYSVLAFPPAGSDLHEGALQHVVVSGGATVSGQDIVLQGPQPLPAGSTINSTYTTASGTPVIYWQSPLHFTRIGAAT